MSAPPRPSLTIIAGPNGSGKTTLTRQLTADGVAFGDYINPDDIAATLDGEPQARSLAAQAQADERRAQCLREQRSFTFETVMSHPSKLEVMRLGRARGFSVILYFVGLSHPQLNVERVHQRVALGGHGVPTERIMARYERTMILLPEAFRIADRAFVFDNSETRIGLAAELRLVVAKADGRRRSFPPIPEWVRRRLLVED